MCLASPGKIISIKREKAVVDFGGIKKEVNVSLVKVKVGDYVNVHAGFAIQRLNKKDAFDVFNLYKQFEKSDSRNK